MHEPYSEGNCSRCHGSHTTGQKQQLVSRPLELCAECHPGKMEDHPERGHPMGEITGASAAGEEGASVLLCTDCHDAHTSERPHLLTVSGCLDCHPK